MEKNIFIEQLSDSVCFVCLQKEVYEKKAVMMAANAFSDKCYIKIEEIDYEHIGVWLKLKFEINPQKTHDMIGEFCNEVLDTQIRLDLEDRFGDIRNIIYKKAFDSAGGIDG